MPAFFIYICSQIKLYNMNDQVNAILPENNAGMKCKPYNSLIVNLSHTFSNCLETAKRKNNDYGGIDSNPYANFSNSTIVGVSIEKGILVRMMDKVSRISTLLEKETQVKDEAIEDTLDDLINYTAILKSYLIDKKLKDGKEAL